MRMFLVCKMLIEIQKLKVCKSVYFLHTKNYRILYVMFIFFIVVFQLFRNYFTNI